jgi:hypothetical protein
VGKLGRLGVGGAKEGMKDGAKGLVRREALFIAEKTGATSARTVLMARAVGLLRAAGVKTMETTVELGKRLAAYVAYKPIRAAMLGLVIYFSVKHGPQAEAQFNKWWNSDPAGQLAKALADFPAKLIDSILTNSEDLIRKHPMFAPLFYLLDAALFGALFLLPLAILKWLLPQVYKALAGVAKDIIRSIYSAIARLIAPSKG